VATTPPSGLYPGTDPALDASPYLEALRQRVVVFDGAMGTNLQLRNLGPDDFGGPALEGCNELLVVTRPDVVAAVHRSFYEVGCDVVETDSFGSLPWVLAEYGIAERTRELARLSAELARDVAGEWDGRFVAGSSSAAGGPWPRWAARSRSRSRSPSRRPGGC
jgi:5-methyltetrahydrofolate--homocysteine methyltransferase